MESCPICDSRARNGSSEVSTHDPDKRGNWQLRVLARAFRIWTNQDLQTLSAQTLNKLLQLRVIRLRLLQDTRSRAEEGVSLHFFLAIIAMKGGPFSKNDFQ